MPHPSTFPRQNHPPFPAPEPVSPMLPLTPADIEKHAKLGILPELLYPCVDRANDWLARHEWHISAPGYWDLAGLVYVRYIPRCPWRVGWRLRLDKPMMRNGKLTKYLCPPKSSGHLFYPPGAGVLLDRPDTEIVLVESEKAGLALLSWARRTGRDNLLPLAMGGCWGWHSQHIRIDVMPNGTRVPVSGAIPDLHDCDGRVTYVLFDSNSAVSEDVQLARTRLVFELNRPERNCAVRVIDLPWLTTK